MVLIVQKYGGTSVGTTERIQAVAKRVKKTADRGDRVVMVVSAMGKTTDTLVNLARDISQNPSSREMDMLLSTGEQVSIALMSMALQELGQPAISLTGAQVGIVTEAAHSRARILQIKTDRIKKHLARSQVIVVAGFQGISSSSDLEITTLGRGGSDTSAVALAASLGASCCEIYTDVPGILTTDPRLVPDAKLLTEITCDEMLELASLGAKVLHPRAVEIARNYGVPLVVRSSRSEESGTKVTSPVPMPRSMLSLELTKVVDGIKCDSNQAKVALLRVPDRPGVANRFFGEIARQNVDVDLIIQSIHEGNTNDIAFTVERSQLKAAEAVTEAIAPVLRSTSEAAPEEAEVMVKRDIAKVSIAGAGTIGRPDIAAKMFKTLAEAGINIQMISTSEVQVSCVIDAALCHKAIAALCQAFEIDSSPVQYGGNVSLCGSLARGVALDRNLARLAIRHVSDRLGMAAEIFGTLADCHVSVDTIIQSQRCRIINGIPTRDIAFTVTRADADRAKMALENLARKIGCGEILLDTEIAKVSIVSAAMVGQPGIAARFFGAIADANINIQMITTSEIKISCVVAKENGVAALQAVHQAFGLAGEKAIEVEA